ncbi:hypothetical protein BHUM_06333 [Candidatus Burkholderia humilis]|nr:hypothetical protein BHUM_06333 [Candidatus Burkholderia humilis]
MNSTEKISVFVADHRSAVLTGLYQWFDSQERYRVIGGAQNVDQLFAALSQRPSDLIVMSSDLFDNDFVVLRELRRCLPYVPILIFTTIDEANALRTVQSAGATGIISAKDEMKDFERVCSRVLSGAPGVMSQRVAAICGSAPVEEAPAPELVLRVEEAVRSFGANPPYQGVRISVRPGTQRADSRQQ